MKDHFSTFHEAVKAIYVKVGLANANETTIDISVSSTMYDMMA